LAATRSRRGEPCIRTHQTYSMCTSTRPSWSSKGSPNNFSFARANGFDERAKRPVALVPPPLQLSSANERYVSNCSCFCKRLCIRCRGTYHTATRRSTSSAACPRQHQLALGQPRSPFREPTLSTRKQSRRKSERSIQHTHLTSSRSWPSSSSSRNNVGLSSQTTEPLSPFLLLQTITCDDVFSHIPAPYPSIFSSIFAMGVPKEPHALQDYVRSHSSSTKRAEGSSSPCCCRAED
jgi:hypothetical protein